MNSMHMELLITIIKDYKKVEEILLGFIEIEVTGSTVIEGKGMGQLLGDVPIHASLRGLFPGSAVDSYVILTVEDASRVMKACELIEKVCGSMNKPSEGVLFSVPVNRVRGLTKST